VKLEDYYDWDAEERLQNARDEEAFDRYLQHLEEEEAYARDGRDYPADDPRGV